MMSRPAETPEETRGRAVGPAGRTVGVVPVPRPAGRPAGLVPVPELVPMAAMFTLVGAGVRSICVCRLLRMSSEMERCAGAAGAAGAEVEEALVMRTCGSCGGVGRGGGMGATRFGMRRVMCLMVSGWRRGTMMMVAAMAACRASETAAVTRVSVWMRWVDSIKLSSNMVRLPFGGAK